jgi:lysozyme
MIVSNSLLESVEKHEGFRESPYDDHLGNTTFGHGLTWISKNESLMVMHMRLRDIQEDLANSLNFWSILPHSVKDCVTEMSYQMGTVGVLRFENMMHALARSEWSEAADHGMDSKWALQTPERAVEMMTILRNTP